MVSRPRLRVVAFTLRRPNPPGYLGEEEYREQRLQARLLGCWVTLATEEVPWHVVIAEGALGPGAGGWRSAFAGLPGVDWPRPA